jgi:hypothetical protein
VPGAAVSHGRPSRPPPRECTHRGEPAEVKENPNHPPFHGVGPCMFQYVIVNELRLGFSNTSRNPEGILSHNNRKS